MFNICINKNIIRTNLFKYLLYLVGLFILFFIMYKPAMLSIDAHHDGTMFNPALIIARGGKMYKDTSTYYGVLTTYIQALFLKMFGETLWSMRLSGVVFYVFSFIMYFNIFKRILPKKMVLFSEILLVFIAPYWMRSFHAWSSIYALFFILCYIYFYIRFFETNKKTYMFLVGFSTALIFFSRTPCGIVFILASFIMHILVCWLYRDTNEKIWSNFIWWTIGILSGILPFILSIAIQGGIEVWWNSCIKHPFLNTFGIGIALNDVPKEQLIKGLLLTDNFNLGSNIQIPESLKLLVKCLFPLNNSGVFIFLPIANLYVFFVMISKLYKLRGENCSSCQKKDMMIILCISLCSLGSWHQYFAVSCARHWYWAGFPMFGILAYLIYELFDKNDKKWQAYIAMVGLLTICLTTIYERLSIYELRKEKYTEEINEELCSYLKGIKLSEEQMEFYTDYCELIDFLVEEYPNKRIINQSFSIFLESLNRNERTTIDDSESPIIVNNDTEVDGNTNYYMAVEIEQKYPEQDTDPHIWKIRFHLPNE